MALAGLLRKEKMPSDRPVSNITQARWQNSEAAPSTSGSLPTTSFERQGRSRMLLYAGATQHAVLCYGASVSAGFSRERSRAHDRVQG